MLAGKSVNVARWLMSGPAPAAPAPLPTTHPGSQLNMVIQNLKHAISQSMNELISVSDPDPVGSV